MSARAFVVGAGPGDPGLVTVRGAEVIASAHFILYDPAVHPDVVARGAAAEGRVEAVRDPRANAERLMAAVRAGKTAVRLVDGHPGAFTPCDEELLVLREGGIDFEVVPGIPSARTDRRPLFGKRVLVTRALEQAQSAAELVRERGAEPVLVPTIAIDPPADPAPFQRAVKGLSSYEWVAFTSSNGVDRTFTEITRQGKDARAFGAAKIAAIGPGTAGALERYGLRADVVAAELRGEGLAKTLIARLSDEAASDDIPGRRMPRPRVLLLRAKVAREVLPDALRGAGCEVDVVAAYETRAPEGDTAAVLSRALAPGGADAVLFTSGSTVDQLCELLGDEAASVLSHVRVASIGPITTAVAQKHGIRVDVTAKVSTLEGLLDALETSFTVGLGGA